MPRPRVNENYPLLATTEDYFQRQDSNRLRTQKRWRSAILAFAITVLTIAAGLIVVTSEGRMPLEKSVSTTSPSSGPLKASGAEAMSARFAEQVIGQIQAMEDKLKEFNESSSTGSGDGSLSNNVKELMDIAHMEGKGKTLQNKVKKLRVLLQKQQSQKPQQPQQPQQRQQKKKGGHQPQQPQQDIFLLKATEGKRKADPLKSKKDKAGDRQGKKANVTEIMESVGKLLDKIGSNLIPTKYLKGSSSSKSSADLNALIGNVTKMFEKVANIEEKLDKATTSPGKQKSLGGPLKMSFHEGTDSSSGPSGDDVTKMLQSELNGSRRDFYTWLGKLADNMTVVFDRIQDTVSELSGKIHSQGGSKGDASPQSRPLSMPTRGQVDMDVSYGGDSSEKTTEKEKTSLSAAFDYSQYKPKGGDYSSYYAGLGAKADKLKEKEDVQKTAKGGQLGKPYYGLPPQGIMDSYMPKSIAKSLSEKVAKKKKKDKSEGKSSVEASSTEATLGNSSDEGSSSSESGSDPSFVQDYGKIGKVIQTGFEDINKRHMKEAMEKNKKKQGTGNKEPETEESR